MSLSPGVQAVFDKAEKHEAAKKKAQEKGKKKQVVSEADRLLTVPPELVPTKSGAEASISTKELDVIQETLDATKHLVPADSPEIP